MLHTCLHELLKVASAKFATDLHLIEGRRPTFRIAGKCIPVASQEITQALKREWHSIEQSIDEFIEETVVRGLLPESRATRQGILECDQYRARVSKYYAGGQACYAFRFNPQYCLPWDNLGLSSALRSRLESTKNGLILWSGAQCAGKTTSMYSMLQHLAENTSYHIRTLDNPMEYRINDGPYSLVTQQYVSAGQDVGSYQNAVESALRHDTNVIGFSEIIDLESLREALLAANLNVLVMGTIHAHSVRGTILRVINQFPESDRIEARYALARALRAIVTQRLIAKPEGVKLVYQAVYFDLHNSKFNNALAKDNLQVIDEELKRPDNKNCFSDGWEEIEPSLGGVAGNP